MGRSTFPIKWITTRFENTLKQAERVYGSLKNGRLYCHPKALFNTLHLLHPKVSRWKNYFLVCGYQDWFASIVVYWKILWALLLSMTWLVTILKKLFFKLLKSPFILILHFCQLVFFIKMLSALDLIIVFSHYVTFSFHQAESINW